MTTTTPVAFLEVEALSAKAIRATALPGVYPHEAHYSLRGDNEFDALDEIVAVLVAGGSQLPDNPIIEARFMGAAYIMALHTLLLQADENDDLEGIRSTVQANVSAMETQLAQRKAC